MIARFEEGAATVLLEQLRWGEDGPRCPRCGGTNLARVPARKVRRCRGCRYFFSVTSGTVFDRHKMSHEQIVRAMLWWEDTGGKGRTADLARLLGCEWKTAYVLKMRLWEDTVSGGALKAEPFFARRYWQGFNRWRVVGGKLMRENKHGQMQEA